MHNTYVIEQSSMETLRSKYVLLDTNFLIDASMFRQEVGNLIDQLNSLGCSLLTTRSVILEALGGTNNENDLDDKLAYLEIVFGRPFNELERLPIERRLPDKAELLSFSRQCNKFATTDFELFLMLEKYKSSGILLISRNHKDFTSKICNRTGFITLLGNKEIRTYGIYQAK